MFKYVPEKNIFIAKVEIECPLCNGFKEIYKEVTESCGSGYFPCDYCKSTGIVQKSFEIPQEEVFEEIQELKGMYLF